MRLIKTFADGMIADVEIEMFAHAFVDRVTMQDELCLKIREDMLSRIKVKDVRVWLVLSELGHSWKL